MVTCQAKECGRRSRESRRGGRRPGPDRARAAPRPRRAGASTGRSATSILGLHRRVPRARACSTSSARHPSTVTATSAEGDARALRAGAPARRPALRGALHDHGPRGAEARGARARPRLGSRAMQINTIEPSPIARDEPGRRPRVRRSATSRRASSYILFIAVPGEPDERRPAPRRRRALRRRRAAR